MLVTLNHGQKIEPLASRDGPRTTATTPEDTTEYAPAGSVLGYDTGTVRTMRTDAAVPDRFGYMFDGGGIPETANAFDKLGAIGAAMTTGDLPGPSGLPAVLTYFGQFVDHDITANTDREPEKLPSFAIGAAPLTINSRDDVRAQLGNLRRGTLRLDSVYGDNMPIDAKLRDGARMRVGLTTGGQENDLPRFGPLILNGVLTAADLPDTSGMRSDFGPVDPAKIAFIGDGRNDENLVVAQLHLSMLRFHNRVADALTGSDDERFARAKQLTQWHYQWLLVEHYLTAICDPAALNDVIARGANRYTTFAARHGGASGDSAPMPVEFSVAAFRFGHSMIRQGYVFNRFFRPADEPPVEDRIGPATLRELFQFTGRGGLGGADVLPDVWIIDWSNFIARGPDNRLARTVDPALAPALGDMVNEHPIPMRSLAQRNLRRGYVLGLPTAQTVAAQLENDGIDVDFLSSADIVDSPGGAEVRAQGFETLTPLWYYILIEAAKQADGRHLGKLGSLIVAETLIGLLVIDPESYWHAGKGGGRWTPADAGLGGAPVDGFESFFRFAGVL